MQTLAPRSFLAAALLALAAAPRAQEAEAVGTKVEPVDQKAVAILREQGLQHSQVMEHLSWMCDVYGPRLTGSPNLTRAQDWAVKTFAGFGLADARKEAWGPFGRGWSLEHVAMHVVGENPWPVIAYAKAWSPSLPGRVEAEVVHVADLSADALEAMDLTGKVVLLDSTRTVSEPFAANAHRLDATELLGLADHVAVPASLPGQARPVTDFRREVQRRDQILQIVAGKKPLAIVDRGSKGDYGTVFVGGASTASEGERVRTASATTPAVIPQLTIAVEHYNRMCRLLAKKVPVRVALELRATFSAEDRMEHNVLADLPGSDPVIGREVVMLGAHFDSWHTGTGATDNGCGSAVVMEAMRLLTVLAKELGHGPRRTIRCALWSGEEQGLLGSRAYVRDHFAAAERGKPVRDVKSAHALLAGYFNLDNGTGRVRGVYLQGNEAAAPIFRAWLQPFHDLDAHTLTLSDTGGTDHLSFDAVGLPGFQFIQDPVSYSPRTHHSNMDNWDHAIGDDLKQAATIMATFAWHTAQRDEKLPRKELADVPAGGAGR